MRAERRALGLASFTLGLFAAVLLFLPSSDHRALFVSACVCLALMLLFGLAWLTVTALETRRRAGQTT